MLSSLRPQALKVLEEVATAYHRQFDRPLPVSSLVRPEQYQRALRRVNRNAVMIDTPPHSTGLAFDIDYRYMSAAEQSFVMNELARMKTEGVSKSFASAMRTITCLLLWMELVQVTI
jgi:hypothetical protein